MTKERKGKVVAVSGGFDPIHIGHVRMIREARALGDYLIVIVNNDNWLTSKKGFAFMSQEERVEILEAFSFVDEVVLTGHEAGGDYHDVEWRSVCRELEAIKPHIFANGGDRALGEIPEVTTCNAHGIEMVFNIGKGGKVQSSSWLVSKHKE